MCVDVSERVSVCMLEHFCVYLYVSKNVGDLVRKRE